MSALELKLPPPLVAALSAVLMWGISWFSGSVELGPLLRGVLTTVPLIAGLILIGSAVRGLRRARTTVSPLHPEETRSIVDSGVFAWSRNPVYLGLVLIVLAWAVWLQAPWAVPGVVFCWAWLTRFQIIPEERALSRQFGQAYQDYRRRVRRWI